MQHSSIIAILKKKKATHNYGTVFIRGYFNNKPVAAKTTGYKVLITNWDTENHRVVDKAPNAKLINTCIISKIQEMEKMLLQTEIMGNAINRRHIKCAVKGYDAGKDFIKFSEENIKQKYSNEGTKRVFLSELNKIKKFRSQISFADIDFKFLTDYKTYMRTELKNCDNTIWKTFKCLRTLILDAVKHGGIIQQDPFKEFDRGKYIQPDTTFLTMDECERIYALTQNDLLPVLMRRVAMYFLLMCYSGLRFEDAITFNPETHIIENQRLVRKTSKGEGTIINIKLYGRLQEIVEMIKTNPLKLSNQKINEWLKLIAVHACISKNLHCHVGRHTFGSFLVDAGAPIETAQKLLGHKDVNSTKVYYHIKQKNEDDAIDKLNAL